MSPKGQQSTKPTATAATEPKWKPVHCQRCDGIGWLSYIRLHRGRGYKFAYRCSCPNGDRLSATAQRFDDAFPESRGVTQADLNIANGFTAGPEQDDVTMQRKGVEYLRGIFTPGSDLRQRMDAWADRAGIFKPPASDEPPF